MPSAAGFQDYWSSSRRSFGADSGRGRLKLEPATSGVTKRLRLVSSSRRLNRGDDAGSSMFNEPSRWAVFSWFHPVFPVAFSRQDRRRAAPAVSAHGHRLGALRAVGFSARLADQGTATNQFAPSKDHGCDEARSQRPGGGETTPSSIPPGVWSSCGRPSSADPLPPDRSTSPRAWQAALQREVAAEAPPPPVAPAPVAVDGA